MPERARSASSSPSRRRHSGCAYRLEQCCCGVLTYFPLVFVYGLTSWAAWVGVSMGFAPYSRGHIANHYTSALVAMLYVLADSSYTAAVFTNPGSPVDPMSTAPYNTLPTSEPERPASSGRLSSLTTKSTGKPRYCKKCACPKPDRTHHCSSCNQCVLKMDHHCPWLATCVGFRNYKHFLLFLIYVTLFCWVTFSLSAEWVWRELFNVSNMAHSSMTVNIVLLAVLAGIIGLVLTGFTAWHIYLAVSGQTTIECLEKTRYLSPLKDSMAQQLRRAGQRDHGAQSQSEPLLNQLKEIHANALPGVTRPEEGESYSGSSTPSRPSPASDSLRRSYRELEEQRERDRYAQYLDEQDNKRLPHAFDLGWRRNLELVFGPSRLRWALPLTTTVGDGWTWQVSDHWLAVRDEIARERMARAPGFASPPPVGPGLGLGAGRHYYDPSPHPPPPQGARRTNMELRRLGGDEDDVYDTSSDEDRRGAVAPTTGNWNDVPAEHLRRAGGGSNSGRTKGD